MKKVVGIAGAGMMGRGIAQVAAMAGWEVRLFDINEKVLKQAKDHHSNIFAMLASRGKISDQEKKAYLSRIYYTPTLSLLGGSSLVIEAIIEDINVKKELFRQIEKHISSQIIFASNTSSLSITEIASTVSHPENFLGIHFFNPAPLMPLVEIIPAYQTKQELVVMCSELMEAWGKIPVVASDTPGFIVNKVARPYYSEALRIYEEGLASKEEIDQAMEAKDFRMGPFTLMDFIGHDVNYAVTESVWKAFYHEPRYQPSLTQLTLVRAGKLGRKTGEGFYQWDGKNANRKLPSEPAKNWIFKRILVMLINEAADTVYKNFCSEKDVELAMTKGVNYPKGLLQWGEEWGYINVVNLLDELYELYHEERYRVSPWIRSKAEKNE